MADILNLRRFRKAKRRADHEAASDRNRATFGRSKSDLAAAKATTDHAERLLDGHLRIPLPPAEPDPDGSDA